MKLISPKGVRVSVRDEKGERLLTEGYRRAEDDSPADPPADDSHTPKRKPKANTKDK